MTMPSIEALDPAGFDAFLAYLNEHLAENGSADTGYFQPLSRSASSFPAERAAAFRAGLEQAVGARGWRRAWIARSVEGAIIGHIDLRGHAEGFAEHRCMLGMGVHRLHRKAGLGSALIAHARLWAGTAAAFEWIDLQVLSENRPALALYRRAGFVVTGEVPQMFRIDGRDLSYTSMTLRLAADRHRGA